MNSLVAGAGGFIGGHLTRRLLDDGHRVRCVDSKPLDRWDQLHPEAENWVDDLRIPEACATAVTGTDRVFLLSADMGGIGFIENHKSSCMLSVLITANVMHQALLAGVERLFFASSACVYPVDRQADEGATPLVESDAYPAMPEDGYGWEKLFGERLCQNLLEDHGLQTRVARYHNVYGPYCTWRGGREKAPAALARKVAVAKRTGDHRIEVWGDGKQRRSFLYIDDCIEATVRLMESAVTEPVNVGSEEVVSIADLLRLTAEIAGIEVEPVFDLSAPQGVRCRSSDNRTVTSAIGWRPTVCLSEGMAVTYDWISHQLDRAESGRPSG